MVTWCQASIDNHCLLSPGSRRRQEQLQCGNGFYSWPLGPLLPRGETSSGIVFCQGVDKSLAGFAVMDLGRSWLGDQTDSVQTLTVPLASCGPLLCYSASLCLQFLICQMGCSQAPAQGIECHHPLESRCDVPGQESSINTGCDDTPKTSACSH